MLRRLMRRLGRTCRSRRVSVPLLVVCVSLLILFALGYAGATGYGPPPGAGRGFLSRAESTITVGDGIQLRRTKFEKGNAGVDFSHIEQCAGYSEIPVLLETGAAVFCYATYATDLSNIFGPWDTGFHFWYDILVPTSSGAWTPSGFYVEGGATVPMLLANTINCTIHKSGTTTPAQGAPFHCDAKFDRGGNDAKPHWTITANPVQVIDATDSGQVTRAADLIGANCQSYDTPSCNWTRTQKSSVFAPDENDWVPITDWADSCPPVQEGKETEVTFTRSVDVSWTDTVGGKISGKIKPVPFIASIELEATYEHSIAQTDTWATEYKYIIPHNYRSALYLQHGMLSTTGDFAIVTRNGDRYLVKNATFTFPVNKDVQVEGRGQPIKRGYVHHVDIPCSEKPPARGAPPPANANVGLARRIR